MQESFNLSEKQDELKQARRIKTMGYLTMSGGAIVGLAGLANTSSFAPSLDFFDKAWGMAASLTLVAVGGIAKGRGDARTSQLEREIKNYMEGSAPPEDALKAYPRR